MPKLGFTGTLPESVFVDANRNQYLWTRRGGSQCVADQHLYLWTPIKFRICKQALFKNLYLYLQARAAVRVIEGKPRSVPYLSIIYLLSLV